jgi:hypothetical protein
MAKVIFSERIRVQLKGLWGVYSGILKNGFRSPISYFLFSVFILFFWYFGDDYSDRIEVKCYVYRNNVIFQNNWQYYI